MWGLMEQHQPSQKTFSFPPTFPPSLATAWYQSWLLAHTVYMLGGEIDNSTVNHNKADVRHLQIRISLHLHIISPISGHLNPLQKQLVSFIWGYHLVLLTPSLLSHTQGLIKMQRQADISIPISYNSLSCIFSYLKDKKENYTIHLGPFLFWGLKALCSISFSKK